MATAAQSTNRIEILAKPKSLTNGFMEDRRSVYWVDKAPPKPGSDGVTVCVLSERQAQLVYNKRLNSQYQGDRPSPIWPVSEAAKQATASHRVTSLSNAKPIHKEYIYDRSVKTIIPDSAKKCTATPRIEALARAKTYHPLPILDLKEWDWSDWNDRVPKTALSAHCSGRIEDLARAKQAHKWFSPNRPIRWEVFDSAKTAVASVRVTSLALPKTRTSLNEDYDPYKVTVGARRAQATPRVHELCLPIPRKCRTKKV